MCYQETRKPVPQICRELKVEAVVEGTVLRFADRVRITVRLIDGATDRPLWTGSYEHDYCDMLALQSQVAQAIAREIRIKVTP
jgi:TolB-like protein